MTRDEFDSAAAALIRRHWRHMDDLGGRPPAALLDGLWAIAGQHADDTGVVAVKREDDLPPDRGIPDMPALRGERTTTPAPRRGTRRSTPK